MSLTTPVVNKHSREPFDIYIGRGSIWGNPFVMQRGSNALENNRIRRNVISQYESYLLASPELLPLVASLYGKRLQCFCAPLPCHGDVLAHYADAFVTTGMYPMISALNAIYPDQP